MIKPFKLSTPLCLSVLAALTFILYGIILDVPFVLDDMSQIVENSRIKNPARLGELWFFKPQRFIPNLSFALNHSLSGLHVTGYHLVNNLIHFLNGCLVFALVRSVLNLPRIEKEVPGEDRSLFALMAACLFLVHPVQTQAVTYTVQRVACLTTLFYLAALWMYVRSRVSGKQSLYWGALAMTVLAMSSKEIAFTLPLMFCFVEYFLIHNSSNRIKDPVLHWLPIAATLVLIPVFHLVDRNAFSMQGLLAVTRETEGISRSSYLFTQFRVIVTYLRLLFLPIGQRLEYDFPIYDSPVDPPVFISAVALALLFGFALGLRHHRRLISFGVFFFFISISIESSLIPIADIIFEHRLYLPITGFAIAATAGLFLIPRMKLRLILFSVWILVLAFLTFQRNQMWRDPVRLLAADLAGQENLARPQTNLGNYYAMRKRFAEAERHYLAALQAEPKNVKTHNNLGLLYYGQGSRPKALHHFRKAIEYDPDFAKSYYNLARYYYESRDAETAESFLKQAIERDPHYPSSYLGLAMIRRDQGYHEMAVGLIKRALELDPDDATLYYQLGNFYFGFKMYPEAVRAYKDAIRKDRTGAAMHAYNNLGNVYFVMKDYVHARDAFEKVLQMNDGFEQIHLNLANVYYELGDKQKADNHYQRAVQLARRHGNMEMLERFENLELSTSGQDGASGPSNP